MKSLNKSAVIECRTDVITLARLATYYAKNGVSISTKSALARTVFEHLTSILEAQELLTPIETAVDAIGTLEVLGLSGFNRSKRGLSTLLQDIERGTKDSRVSAAIDNFTKEKRGGRRI